VFPVREKVAWGGLQSRATRSSITLSATLGALDEDDP
jgi:hypothetical protein